MGSRSRVLDEIRQLNVCLRQSQSQNVYWLLRLDPADCSYPTAYKTQHGFGSWCTAAQIFPRSGMLVAQQRPVSSHTAPQWPIVSFTEKISITVVKLAFEGSRVPISSQEISMFPLWLFTSSVIAFETSFPETPRRTAAFERLGRSPSKNNLVWIVNKWDVTIESDALSYWSSKTIAFKKGTAWPWFSWAFFRAPLKRVSTDIFVAFWHLWTICSASFRYPSRKFCICLSCWKLAALSFESMKSDRWRVERESNQYWSRAL